MRPALLTGAVMWAAAPGTPAQMHHVDKLEKVTRAVGVYEWTGDLAKPTAARFVPVSLFIDGHFEDAGLYLARPVPFALQSGDLYTVQRAGEPEGQLALEEAARVVTGNALADDNPTGAWYAYGKFTAEAPPPPAPALHHNAHPGAITVSSADGSTSTSKADSSDAADKPHMSRRDGGDTAGKGGQPADNGTQASNRSDDDTDRPTLARRDPAQDAARRKAAGGNKGTSSVTAAGPAPGDDPDRPTLSRKPAGEQETQPLTGSPAGVHQAVAVSDAVVRDPHPYARAWESPAERANTLAAMEAIARPRVAAYLTENHLRPGAAVLPVVADTASHEGIAANTETGEGGAPRLERGRPREYGGTESAHPPAPKALPPVAKRAASPAAKSHPATLSLQQQTLEGFTLSYGGLPTFVYNAAVPAIPAVPQVATGTPPATPLTVFLTVVAQRLPSGELQVALTNVTDSQHLDRAQRLRLVDVVDPDGSHRGSLLFELRGSNSRQFALYRLITAKAENTFTTASIE